MSASRTDPARRRFIRLLAAGAVTAPVAGLACAGQARAAELPKLDPESERARQLSYTHDAASTKNPARESGASCANCTHFRGDAGTTWAPCNIFPEHRVNAEGWCTSWFSAA
jgi:hypothetical protein